MLLSLLERRRLYAKRGTTQRGRLTYAGEEDVAAAQEVTQDAVPRGNLEKLVY